MSVRTLTLSPTPTADATDPTPCPACDGSPTGGPAEAEHGLCPHCGTHHRLTATQRMAWLLDPGSMELLPVTVRSGDPLGFVDSMPYPERLEQARTSTGLDEAVLCARGTVQGRPVVTAVMDFRFLGGSLGAAVGELIASAADAALETRTPLLLVTASGGARMQEGATALMQMAKTCSSLAALDEAGVLTVALVTDPTYGGVAASFATACDVVVAEPGARLGFAGPRVIRQTIDQDLPEGFQTAEFLLDRGLVDVVCPRSELRDLLGRLLAVGMRRSPARSVAASASAVVRDPAAVAPAPAWEAVRNARAIARPTTLDYVDRVVDDFVELHGDRLTGECPAIVAGLGVLAGRPVVVVGHQRGHTARELVARRFGMPSPAGYRKAARVMRLAAKLGIGVVTLIDTPGAHPGTEAEAGGQSMAIADNLRLMSRLPVPTVAVVIGEGGSGGALALAAADRVLILSGAVYSVITPEGCAAILWGDRSAAPRAAEALKVGAASLLELGVVDGVLPEPEGGAQADHRTTAVRVRDAVALELADLAALSTDELVARRVRRFRAFGLSTLRPVAAGE